MRVVRSFGQESRHVEVMTDLNEQNRAINMKSVYLNASYFPAVELLAALATAVILVYGGSQAIDGAIQVAPEDAKEMARRCAREEGILVGISSGATLQAIKQKCADMPAGTRILGFNYDTGERYLSVPDFLPEQ